MTTSAPLMGFGSLQHFPESRIHWARAYLTRFGPPSGFGYPPDGFRPSRPGRPCFMPTALMGFLTPFEAFPSRKVPEAVTPPGEPACRCTSRYAIWCAEANPTGPAGCDFQAFTLSRVPCPVQRINDTPDRMLPWALPFLGLTAERLDPASTGSPLTRFLSRR